MKRILVQIVAVLAVFLEFADEDTVELEASVRQLEIMANRLQRLTLSDRREFIALLDEVAAANPNDEERRFLEELPQAMGLV